MSAAPDCDRDRATARRAATCERGGIASALLIAVLVAALVTGAGAVAVEHWWSGSPFSMTTAMRQTVTGWLNGSQMPTPGVDAQPERLLAARTPPADPGEFRFLRTTDARRPVTYSPCRRLDVVVNLAGAPAGALPVVTEAVEQIRQASGLALRVVATTDEPYRTNRKAYQPQRYGDRWAPILVAWAGPQRVPEFAASAVGLGGSYAVTPAFGPTSYVTGALVMDREYFADPVAFGTLTEVVLHEMGHVVGLDHVGDDAQLMWQGGVHEAVLGSGDRAGLARLGRGPCTPDL